MKTLHLPFLNSFLYLISLGTLLISCSNQNQKCNCSENEMLRFVANLSIQYEVPVNKDQVECEVVDEMWLVRLDSLDNTDDMGGYWDGLYDTEDEELKLIIPMFIKKEDVKMLKPIIRKVRSNGYNLSFIRNLEEDSLYAFGITSNDKMKRIIQQQYKYQNGKWVWIKNNDVREKDKVDFRFENLK